MGKPSRSIYHLERDGFSYHLERDGFGRAFSL